VKTDDVRATAPSAPDDVESKWSRLVRRGSFLKGMGAVGAAVNRLTADRLLAGQPHEFFETLLALAVAADAARRELTASWQPWKSVEAAPEHLAASIRPVPEFTAPGRAWRGREPSDAAPSALVPALGRA
jgi:hypothetical protein